MNRNIRLINLYTVCCNMVFILPVVVPYYQHIGLSFRDFLIGEAVFSAVVLLAEVPTGWISDVWRRRSAMVLGMLFGIAGYALLLLADSFWMATTAQGILGIAVAMNSGSVTALLYDTLAEQGRVEDYRRLEGKRHAISLYSVAAASLAGGFLYMIDPKLPLALELFVMTAAMIAMARIIEPARHMKRVEKHPLRDMAETVNYALRGHPEVTGIIILSAVIFCATKLMMWSQQPYYQMVGLPVALYGVVMAGSYLIGGMAGHWSHRLDHLGGNRASLAVIAGALAAACFILGGFPSLFLAVPLFLTGTLAYGMGTPRVNNVINGLVGSERRATILSTASLMVHVLSIPSFIVAGVISDASSVRESLIYLGGQIVVLGGIGLWLWKKNPLPPGEREGPA